MRSSLCPVIPSGRLLNIRKELSMPKEENFSRSLSRKSLLPHALGAVIQVQIQGFAPFSTRRVQPICQVTTSRALSKKGPESLKVLHSKRSLLKGMVLGGLPSSSKR